MQWTESNELTLLLGVLAASNNLSIVTIAEKISKNWPTNPGGDQPTARAIRDRFAKLKKAAMKFNFAAAGSDSPMHKPLKGLSIDESNQSPRFKSEVTDTNHFAAANPLVTPLKSKSASSAFQTPPSTQIFKSAARKRKRKQHPSMEEDEAESSGCESSSDEQITPTQAAAPVKSTRPQRSVRTMVSSFSTYVDDEEDEGVRHRVEDSEDSDADFDLEELRKKEEKEASRGQRRSRR